MGAKTKFKYERYNAFCICDNRHTTNRFCKGICDDYKEYEENVSKDKSNWNLPHVSKYEGIEREPTVCCEACTECKYRFVNNNDYPCRECFNDSLFEQRTDC